MKWQSILSCIILVMWPGKNVSAETSFTGINTLLREYIGRTTTLESLETTVLIQDRERDRYMRTSPTPNLKFKQTSRRSDATDESLLEMHSTSSNLSSPDFSRFTVSSVS
ncbi:unnamed protein product [Euphydryas editha]|uniref:Uncharacterized protein n=1 Tax=Euphydryas editha TaxID=104508 RepID=A0AAU9UF53_EUPED|nr:unnamed protein product [Euphydryas editha]